MCWVVDFFFNCFREWGYFKSIWYVFIVIVLVMGIFVGIIVEYFLRFDFIVMGIIILKYFGLN